MDIVPTYNLKKKTVNNDYFLISVGRRIFSRVNGCPLAALALERENICSDSLAEKTQHYLLFLFKLVSTRKEWEYLKNKETKRHASSLSVSSRFNQESNAQPREHKENI